MNKKLFALIAFFCALPLFSSCGSDDDDEVDEAWKAYNEQKFKEIANDSEYKERKSLSQNGSVYWKDIRSENFFGNDVPAYDPNSKPPVFTDSVVVRYEGSFLKQDGTPYVFDSTEGDGNGKVMRTRVNGLIDGFTTMLQYMRIGEQVDVYIPYQLGYKEAGSYSGYVQTIPGYTTLRFKICLVDVIR